MGTTQAPFGCPVCRATMELVYERPAQKVFVCVRCHSGLTIPAAAWPPAVRQQHDTIDQFQKAIAEAPEPLLKKKP